MVEAVEALVRQVVADLRLVGKRPWCWQVKNDLRNRAWHRDHRLRVETEVVAGAIRSLPHFVTTGLVEPDPPQPTRKQTTKKLIRKFYNLKRFIEVLGPIAFAVWCLLSHMTQAERGKFVTITDLGIAAKFPNYTLDQIKAALRRLRRLGLWKNLGRRVMSVPCGNTIEDRKVWLRQAVGWIKRTRQRESFLVDVPEKLLEKIEKATPTHGGKRVDSGRKKKSVDTSGSAGAGAVDPGISRDPNPFQVTPTSGNQEAPRIKIKDPDPKATGSSSSREELERPRAAPAGLSISFSKSKSATHPPGEHLDSADPGENQSTPAAVPTSPPTTTPPAAPDRPRCLYPGCQEPGLVWAFAGYCSPEHRGQLD